VSGKTGSRPEDFTAAAEAAAGQPLKDWFASVIGAPGEVDYAEALVLYGLDLTRSEGKDGARFVLSSAANANQSHTARRRSWLGLQ